MMLLFPAGFPISCDGQRAFPDLDEAFSSGRSPPARSLYSSTYRKLPAPRSSLDHLEVLLRSPSSTSSPPPPPPSALRNEMRIVSTTEKEQLQRLNDRFVGYIERVRQLEEHNRLLEAEAAALRRRAEPGLQRLYERERRELSARLEAQRHDGQQEALESQRLGRAVQRLREQATHEARKREEAARRLAVARGVAARAALARRGLEQKVEALLGQIAFLRRVHAEEVTELRQETQVSAEVEVIKPDLAVALKEICRQYEALSDRNQQSAEEWYQSRFAHFTEEVARSNDSVRQAEEEALQCRHQLQARNMELEALRGANKSLERRLQEVQESSGEESRNLQATVDELENTLRTTKGEMARHLQEYQELLNVKMALDIEIATYRKLLEGEETHVSTVRSGSAFGLRRPFLSNPLSAFKGFLRSAGFYDKQGEGTVAGWL